MIRDIPTPEKIKCLKARLSFWEFRKLINPGMIIGWWQIEISNQLQQFWDDLCAGKRPKLVVQSPPQHGKSSQIIDFIAWVSGKNPELRTIYASYSERLGVRANLKLQRMFDSEIYGKIFPGLVINQSNTVTISNQKLRNREIIEYRNHEGSFRNTTVRGSVTGETLDFGVIDDPIKGRAEANSEVVRDSTWDWFTDDFFSRFSDHAGLLIILTRWHIDDIVGRMNEKFPDLKIISYPAIADKDEEHRKIGEPLFPELKPIEFLLERKMLMPPHNWEALYQQNPIKGSGNLFNSTWFRYYNELPRYFDEWILSWDMAFKDTDGSDFVVGQCWARKGTEFYLVDQIRDRLDFPATINAFISMCQKYPQAHAKYIEDKANGPAVISTLSGKISGLIPIQPLGSKEARASAASPAIQSGNVFFPAEAHWLNSFESELISFPTGKNDDQVDAMSQAILKLCESCAGGYFEISTLDR